MACFFPDFSDERLCFRRYRFHLPGCLLASEQGDQRLGTVPEVCVPAENHRDERDVGGGAEGRGGQEGPCGCPSDASCRVSFSSGVPCTENDYKLWSPSDERGNECLLGHKTVFKRRTPHATCFNGEDFDRPVVVSNCSCTREDYEWWVLPGCLGTGLCLPQQCYIQTRAWSLPLRERRQS